MGIDADAGGDNWIALADRGGRRFVDEPKDTVGQVVFVDRNATARAILKRAPSCKHDAAMLRRGLETAPREVAPLRSRP